MIKYICLSILFLASPPAFSQDNTPCRVKMPSDIVKIFDQSMALNEKFKESVGGADEIEYQRLRTEIEKYDEETVMPCVRRASRLMIEQSDSVLMHKLMELIISHENSADETTSYAIGKLFANDPAAVEHAIEKFPMHGKKIIFNSVQTGWGNVRPELSAALRRNREERLAKLHLSVVGPMGTTPVRR